MTSTDNQAPDSSSAVSFLCLLIVDKYYICGADDGSVGTNHQINLYEDHRFSKWTQTTEDVPVVCITKGKVKKEPFSLQFATGSFNGDVVLWELTRLSGGESNLVKIKEFFLGYNLDFQQKLQDPRVQVQSLVFSRNS
jgi:hypothetical protein